MRSAALPSSGALLCIIDCCSLCLSFFANRAARGSAWALPRALQVDEITRCSFVLMMAVFLVASAK
jgi:hypothetical protein